MAFTGVATDSPVFASLRMLPAGLIYESFANGITAGTTRTLAGATQLVAEINTITVGTAPLAGSVVGDGIALMQSAPGLTINVINRTLFPIQCYAVNGDTINGVLGSVGVAMPPGDCADFECSLTGTWSFEAGVGSSGQLPCELSAENITAVSPASQSTAALMPGRINHITTVSSAGAGVSLVAGSYGIEQAIENATANPVTVYPIFGGTDAINGQSANMPVLVPGFTTSVFRAASSGQWQSDPYFNSSGAAPSTGGIQAGSGLGSSRSGGNLSIQVSPAGNGNAAATTDTVLFTYALPASSLDIAGRQVSIAAAGSFAVNTNNKQIKLWWGTTSQTVGSAVVGGVLLAQSGVVTTSGGGWSAQVQAEKYGVNGSNTQIATGASVVAGVTHLGTSAPVLLTATENAVINITVTGASSTTGAANDVLAQFFDIAFNN